LVSASQFIARMWWIIIIGGEENNRRVEALFAGNTKQPAFGQRQKSLIK